MNKENIKEVIKEMIFNNEIDLGLTDTSLSKNALLRYLECEKIKHMNRDYKIFVFSNLNEARGKDIGYINACNVLIDCINRGDFDK